MLAEIEKFTSPSTLILSSTSGLLISEIARHARNPERCIGGHPYNPPHIIPLIEMTTGENTDTAMTQCAYDFYKLIGKEPIILKKEAVGFVANRMQTALNREGVDLVSRGVCSIEDIDKAICYGPGLRWALMGPNLVFQLGGGDQGIRGICLKINPHAETWLADMAKWDKFPEGWPETAQRGIDAELANRPAEFGRTNEEIAEFRDRGLFELLKFHKKL